MGIERIESSYGSVYSSDSTYTLNEYGSYDDTSMADSDRVPLLLKPKPRKYSEIEQTKGVTVSWHSLNVYVPVPKKGLFRRQSRHKPFKRVLNNVTGIVEPGSLMAVMGASGAGKTTLMNVLAKRAPGNMVIDGDIRVNGIPIGGFMKTISGYVYQDDLFISTLTVVEHLNFMARMKLDRRLTKWERQRRVEELLIELSLKKCEYTRISGLSGGEKKRLAFASEVISGCPLLFADESTTGLDSFSAQRIVGIMKKLAAKGKTIICTIHQPSSQVFSMFDQVCLLAEGRMAFIGSTSNAMTFLADMGHVCPEHFNPADFYIRTLAVYPGKEEESKKNISAICDAFANSPQYESMEEKVLDEIARYEFLASTSSKHSTSGSSDSFSDQNLLGMHVRRPLWLTQLYWLTWRAVTDSVRNPNIHAVRTIQKIVLALLIGFCFFGISVSQRGIQDVQGAIFVFITENTFPSMYGVLHVFPFELPLFLRENKGGLYGVDSYYLSKMISLVPGFIFEPLIFTTIAYWMVGLRPTSDAFIITSLIILLTANTAAACGCFFSAAFDKLDLAITCLIPFDYILMITGGLFINLGSIPDYISWTKFISWFMYANEAISITQWAGVTNITCTLDADECINTGEEVLESRSINPSHVPFGFTGLITLYLCFHLGAYISLLIKSRRK